MKIPVSWRAALQDEVSKPYFHELEAFVASERASKKVFPPAGQELAALELTSFAETKVLLLGQDPYHDDGQAHGLCFSVKAPTKAPPSLRNIFRELKDDLGVPAPEHGDLTAWAKQGVLLLNTVLTVVAHEANSHKKRGWETFTDAVIERLNARPAPLVFCLWGNDARKKVKLIDTTRHRVIESAHPSPLSVKKFLGSRPFSAMNAALVALGSSPIDWRLDG